MTPHPSIPRNQATSQYQTVSRTQAASRKLVTCALPYANGPIHLGHMLEYIQADIWVRFQKLNQQVCYFVCADDAHGTAIMLKAEAEGCTPEQLIARIQQEHQRDFADFYVQFDHYHSTHSAENRALSTEIFQRNQQQGFIQQKTIQQLFDEEKQLFLADRYVKGQCPKCHAQDQYGDNCEVCGATYAAHELLKPYSVMSGQPPILKDTSQLFFDLPQFQSFLQRWIYSGSLQTEVANKLSEWLTAGLAPWDISRPKPYFGFEIPGHPEHCFYVWLDAPIGYMASFQAFVAERDDIVFDEFWRPGHNTELIHFIGKDIINFHGLFWPALLKGAGYRLPTQIFAHGFVTVNGEKMSKSRGTFIPARRYLDNLNPEYLRYYFASKISPHVEDLDLNLLDLQQKVNSDLVGKYVNLASRCAGFISKLFDGQLADQIDDAALWAELQQGAIDIAACYQAREFAKAMRLIMALADRANQYIDQQAPWVLAKQPEQRQRVQAVCTMGLNAFRLLTLYLKPVLPQTALNVEAFLAIPALTWADAQQPLLATAIQPFKPLMTRIEPAQLERLLEG
jgi:methionyl-tRNA synthetase